MSECRKIEKFEADGDRATFTLSGARTGVANAIRRSVSGSVACFAIDRFTFYENTSAMFDEYIAHRIGLVPIGSRPAVTTRRTRYSSPSRRRAQRPSTPRS